MKDWSNVDIRQHIRSLWTCLIILTMWMFILFALAGCGGGGYSGYSSYEPAYYEDYRVPYVPSSGFTTRTGNTEFTTYSRGGSAFTTHNGSSSYTTYSGF